MAIDRRRLFAALAGAASVAATTPTLARRAHDDEQAQRLKPQPPQEVSSISIRDIAPRIEIDAAALGLRPNAAEDQTKTFQRAIEHAAAAHAVLRLTPGFYRCNSLRLPGHARIAGTPGATRLVLSAATSMLFATGSERIALSGLTLDGADIPLPARRGLVHIAQARGVRIADCEILSAGRNGITFEAVDGEVSGCTISAADIALFSLDGRGLRIAGNTIRGAGNGGILVWRSAPGEDGTQIIDNRIEGVGARAGGSGENGNAINVFRANSVMVRGNRIQNAAFSAIRANAASNLQILGNTCTGLGEVALYAEFGFEGAVIANNIVDGAALGIAVTNFNQGGRLAVVQGNLIRNLVARRPAGTDPNDAFGVGIGIEADTVVTGNVVENAPSTGIAAGWGPHLRDVTVTGNVVRGAGYGITVSVVPGAGAALVADNLISDVRQGAIVGMEWKKPVTGDLSKEGATRYANLSIGGNRVR